MPHRVQLMFPFPVLSLYDVLELFFAIPFTPQRSVARRSSLTDLLSSDPGQTTALPVRPHFPPFFWSEFMREGRIYFAQISHIPSLTDVIASSCFVWRPSFNFRGLFFSPPPCPRLTVRGPPHSRQEPCLIALLVFATKKVRKCRHPPPTFAGPPPPPFSANKVVKAARYQFFFPCSCHQTKRHPNQSLCFRGFLARRSNSGAIFHFFLFFPDHCPLRQGRQPTPSSL